MKYFSLLVVLAVIFIGCRKENENSNSSSILGKWSLLPTTYDSYLDDSLSHTSTENFDASDYLEFKKDGTGFSHLRETNYIFNYRLVEDSILFDNKNKAKITTLTSSNLSYQFSEKVTSRERLVVTFNLKK